MRQFLFLAFLFVVFVQAAHAKSYDQQLDETTAPIRARLRQFHRGAGPCLRYSDHETASPEETAAVARQLFRAGVGTEEFRKILPLILEWARVAEDKAHERSMREEYRATLPKFMTDEQRAQLKTNPADFEKMLDNLEVAPPSGVKEAQASFSQLPPPAQAAVRDAWSRHPQMLYVDPLPFFRALSEETSLQAMEHAGETIRAFYLSHHRWPERSEVEPAGAPWVDARHQPLRYERAEDSVTIGSDWVAPSKRLQVTADGIGPVRIATDICAGLTEVRIPRAAVQKKGELNPLGASVVPSMDGHLVNGFKLFAFEPKSLAARMGFCPGDVVLAAGDYPLTSPERVEEAYARLKDAPVVMFKLLRAGRAITLKVSFE